MIGLVASRLPHYGPGAAVIGLVVLAVVVVAVVVASVRGPRRR